MLLFDKKKIAQVILSETPKRLKEESVSQGIEADFSIAHESLAKEMIDGLQSGDPRKVAQALKQFIQLCEKEEEYSEPEGE